MLLSLFFVVDIIGALRWGIVHTDKFWRENAKFLERDDFALLKSLIALLPGDGLVSTSTDPTVVAIALYDIGHST